MSDITFSSQSTAWLASLAHRKRRPVAPSSMVAFSRHVRRLLPIIGADTKLADVANKTMKDLATQLVAEGLSPKTVGELVATAKKVVASAVNDEGEQLFPRTWNNEFLDLPTISKQKQPCASSEDVERAIKNATSHQEQLLYGVLAGLGLRISEALSIHAAGNDNHTSWDATIATITIRSSVYNGAEQHRVKTEAGNRVVDADPRLNAVIERFVAEHKIQPGAFLFQSKSGRAMHLRTATARLKKHGIHGFHAFRRHRTTRLRELGAPEDIIRYWLGHAGQGITDRYSKLGESVGLRRDWATRVGIGFSLEHIGAHPGTHRGEKGRPKKSHHRIPQPEQIQVDTPTPPSQKVKIRKIGISQTDPEIHDSPPVARPLTGIQPPAVYVPCDDDLDEFFQQPPPTQEQIDAERARIGELREMVEGI